MARKSQSIRSQNYWPGFVDALAALLLVTIFLLVVFVLAQIFLTEALSGRDKALEKLNSQVLELTGLLSLEKETIVVNFCSKPFNPKKEFGINFKSLNIKLPKMKFLISRKDKNLPNLQRIIKQ